MWAGASQPLAFTAAVFNVAGKQRTVAQIDTGELDTVDDVTGLPNTNPDYRRPVAYQAPRYFRFGVRYDFSL